MLQSKWRPKDRSVADEEQARAATQAFSEAKQGWLRFGIGETMTGETLLDVIREIRTLRPGVEIVVFETYTNRLLPRLLGGELDFITGVPISSTNYSDSVEQ